MRNKMRQEREGLRYSLRDLSKKSGLSEDFLMKVELGRQTPSIHNAEKIYDALRKMGMSPEVSLRELFVDDGIKK